MSFLPNFTRIEKLRAVALKKALTLVYSWVKSATAQADFVLVAMYYFTSIHEERTW